MCRACADCLQMQAWKACHHTLTVVEGFSQLAFLLIYHVVIQGEEKSKVTSSLNGYS